MNLKHYAVGDVSFFYAQPAEERARQNRAIRAGHKKVLFECITDDCFTTIRTGWGPNAKVSITVAKYGKDGKTVITEPSIQIDRIEDGNEIPLQYNAYEWENHVLEFLVKACNNVYAYKTPRDMSQEAIERAKKPLETKSDTVNVPSSLNITWTDLEQPASVKAFVGDWVARSEFIPPADQTRGGTHGSLKKLDELHSQLLTRTFTFEIPSGFRSITDSAPEIGAVPQQVILPTPPIVGLYGKKTIRMQGSTPDELTLVPPEETVREQPPAAPVSFLKRIISLLNGR